MNPGKRKDMPQTDNKPKRVKKECDYGERCYRRNPAHFREFSHRHLEAILDTYSGTGPYGIPDKYSMDSVAIAEQLDVIVEKQFYTPWIKDDIPSAASEQVSVKNMNGATSNLTPVTSSTTTQKTTPSLNTSNTPSIQPASSSSAQNIQIKPLKGILKRSKYSPEKITLISNDVQNTTTQVSKNSQNLDRVKNQLTSSKKVQEPPNTSKVSPMSSKIKASGDKKEQGAESKGDITQRVNTQLERAQKDSCNSGGSTPNGSDSLDGHSSLKVQSSDYRPIVPPTRRVEDYLNVVVGKNKMAEKHENSAPYYMFYTTITAARETHYQPYSITFQEILDRSLGELKCSLQINFMVDPGWLLAQYYFAGYSEKKLTILYGEESPDLATITKKKPHVDAHLVRMATPFGKHHTKMMVLCYEDGSLRVVVSTANLYLDDWENRVQGLWFSPRCPELPPTAMPHDGESPTQFKRSLLRYLNNYQLPTLTTYIERVKRCDFSHINVFLVSSVPGSHFDTEWGMTRAGSLLRQHCAIPGPETKQWPLLAQASSIGSYGKEPNLWLTGDFLHHFTKIKEQPQTLSSLAALKLIYPSLENVQRSHDGLLGGGCLPYAASAHSKQPWLNDFLYQWHAVSTGRDRAMPHIKSYTRVSPDNKRAAFFLLTSGNISKAAWGSINKGNAACRIMSYEAGVLFLPRFVINEDFFPLQERVTNRLILPYDLPPTKYTSDMSPWVSDYLMG